MATVLIVDDEADLRYLMRRFLERAGFTVAEASNGQAALEHISSRRPDLVLTDTAMPVLDGNELIGRLRGDPDLETLPVILWGDNPDREVGADRVFAKPYGGPAIVAAVRDLLES